MNAQMPSKMTIYYPNDVARTTIKETNIHNNHEGFVKGEIKNHGTFEELIKINESFIINATN